MTARSGTDVTVIGAGVVGLSTAWQLACRGAEVLLLDAGPPGGGASHAAQGEMVPPAPPLGGLWRHSLELYERLADDHPVEYDRPPRGTLVVGLPGRPGPAVRRTAAAGEHLAGDDLHGFEPALAPRVRAGLRYTEGRRLGPRSVVTALTAAAAW